MQRLCVTSFSRFQSHNNVHCRFMLFSTSSSIATDSFANYLIDSLGFSHQQALSVSTKLSKYNKVNDFNFVANATSVFTFFRHYGFDNTRLVKIVSHDPRLLYSNVDNTIQPKFKFLLDHGFSKSDIMLLISANPKLLSSALESSISPALDNLRQLLVCDTLVISTMKKLCWHRCSSVCNNLMPNVALLRGYGIPIELIRKHLVQKPMALMQSPGKFKETVIKVEKNIGISPHSPMFLYGILLVSGYSAETIESKCRMFKSFGWTQSDVDTLMIKRANCFSLSEASFKKKLDFLMNELRLEPSYLTSHVYLLTYSLEKKIVPRHKALLVLKEKGLLIKYPSLSNAVKMSETSFLERFVVPFKEVHHIYPNYNGCESCDSMNMHPTTESRQPFLQRVLQKMPRVLQLMRY